MRVFKRIVPELSQRDTVRYWGTKQWAQMSGKGALIRPGSDIAVLSLCFQRGWGTSPAGPPSSGGVKMLAVKIGREKWGVKIGNTQIGL